MVAGKKKRKVKNVPFNRIPMAGGTVAIGNWWGSCGGGLLRRCLEATGGGDLFRWPREAMAAGDTTAQEGKAGADGRPGFTRAGGGARGYRGLSPFSRAAAGAMGEAWPRLLVAALGRGACGHRGAATQGWALAPFCKRGREAQVAGGARCRAGSWQKPSWAGLAH
jgi:hypothetical protein